MISQPCRRRISLASGPFADPAGRPSCSSKKPPASAGVYRNSTRAVSVLVFFHACGTPRGKKAQVPRPADRYLVANLDGYFAAQHVGHLVAIAVKMECRLGPSRRGFLERHDSVAGQQLGVRLNAQAPCPILSRHLEE